MYSVGRIIYFEPFYFKSGQTAILKSGTKYCLRFKQKQEADDGLLEVSAELSIPVIGIGSGRRTDGQVLVLQDLLGMTHDLAPKFVKRYLEGYTLMKDALDRFDAEIKNGGFPEDPAKHQRVAKA